MKKIVSLVLALAMLLCVAGAFAEDAEHVEYSGTEVTGALGKTNATANFRSVPSTKTGKILAEIPNGTQVEITAIPDNEDDGWYRVRYDGQSGYVYCNLVDVINAGTPVKDAELNGAKGQVTADGVRLRKEANTNADVLASLNDGTEVELLENEPVWEAQSITKSGTSGDFSQFTDFAFGEPSVIVLADGSLLVVLWYQQNGINGIRYVRLVRE